MAKKVDVKYLKALAKKDKRIGKLFDKLIDELAKVGLSITDIPTDKLFSFEDYPEAAKKTAKLLNNYTILFVNEVKTGIKQAYSYSFNADTYISTIPPVVAQYLINQRDIACDAFIQSRLKPEVGLSLSQRIWNYVSETKTEFEWAMSEEVAEGLHFGTSAEELGRKIRNKLRNPDAMYRRYHEKKILSDGRKKDVAIWRKKVVDSEGKVHFVKTDLEKVGQGMYRSARKNALRVARNEINMAYHYADIQRWQSEPFVTGFHIQLSGNHPVVDMCDELQGDYPKTFLWTKWHVNCRCVATPILVPLDEMKQIQSLPEEEYQKYRSPNLITKMPKQFNEYLEKNKERILNAKERGTLPYWCRDNEDTVFSLIDPDYKPKKLTALQIAEKRHQSRTQQQIDAILKANDARHKKQALTLKTAKNILKVAEDWGEVDSTELQQIVNSNNLTKMRGATKALAKEIVKMKKAEQELSYIIPNVHQWHKQFTIEELTKVKDSVMSKLMYLSGKSDLEKIEKLQNEIIYVADGTYLKPHTVYSTWEVAQQAYQKQLLFLQKQIVLDKIEPVKTWLIKHPKAQKFVDLVAKVELMADQDVSITILENEIDGILKMYQGRLSSEKSAQKKKKDDTEVFTQGDVTYGRGVKTTPVAKSLTPKQYIELAYKAYDELRTNTPVWKELGDVLSSKTPNITKVKSLCKQLDLDFDDTYSKARKDFATRTHYARESKEVYGKIASKFFKKATEEQKKAEYEYTRGSGHMNRPLRGYSGGWDESDFRGVGQVDLNNESYYGEERIKELTDFIDNSSYGFDVMIQRGIDDKGLRGLLGVDNLRKETVMSKVGSLVCDLAFSSCGTSVGSGFGGNILYIYAPRGTKMLYVEGHSAFNDQGEDETIMQRNTWYRITNAYETYGKWNLDVEVMSQI